MARKKKTGSVRTLPSGRHQARISWKGEYHTALFDHPEEAYRWLAQARQDLEDGVFEPEEKKPKRPLTFGEYANEWLATKELKPRTRQGYTNGIASLCKYWGSTRLERITAEKVRRWYATLDPSKATTRAHTYSLFRSVILAAMRDGLLAQNPCTIPGAGRSPKPKREAIVLSPAEVNALASAIVEPYPLMVQIAAWGGLRWGEITELRAKDVAVIDVQEQRVVALNVRRGVTRISGEGFFVGTPKSDAGSRIIYLPPHLTSRIEERIQTLRADDLLFARRNGKHLPHSSMRDAFSTAADSIGKPELTFHELRHTGATLASYTGATLKELQTRLGHSTVDAAMRYQHAAQDRQAQLALLLGDLAK